LIAVVVLTHNRVDLLRRCVENVLLRTSELTTEIVIWNNASTDGTRVYLESLSDPRFSAVHHPENLAMNGLRPAIQRTTAPYLIELDDDVVEAPERWDATLLDAYRRLPEIGFLCASIAENLDDAASTYIKYMREQIGAYTPREVNGVRILEGSVGGACTMTSRDLYERVGGFKQHRRFPYWRPDIPYQRAIRKLGYDSAFLTDLHVRHEGGWPAASPAPKTDYHRYEQRRNRRRNLVKRVILALPYAAALNRRFQWFDPPLPRYDPGAYLGDGATSRSHQPTSTK
jgi:O-antigen biosynthesis protein